MSDQEKIINNSLLGWFSPKPESSTAVDLTGLVAGGLDCRSGPGYSVAAPEIETRGDLLIASTDPLPGASLDAFLNGLDTNTALAVSKLSGSFAVAVLNMRSRRLVLALDRVGIRALAYRQLADGQLGFASASTDLVRMPGFGADVSPQAIYDYFLFHMVPSPDTVFAGVAKLRPGHLLHCDARGHRAQRYWMPEFTAGRGNSIAELKRELPEVLRAAVSNCDIDPATGAFLSGGVDSSTVAGYLAEALPAQAQTFSVGFAGADDYDELEYARITNRAFGLQGHEYDVTPEDIIEAVPRIAAAYDEPFGNSSAVPTLKCAEFARQHGVDHLLAGDGGDELFAGNPQYARQKLFQPYASLPGFARSFLSSDAVLSVLRGPLHKLGSYVRQAEIPMPDRNWSWNYMFRQDQGEVFTQQFLALVRPEHALDAMRSVFAETPDDLPLVDRMLFQDWQFVLADSDLRKVGRMCELAGVKVSFPMLDDRLVELSTRVPASAKLPGLKLRHFYKTAMQDFLPAEVLRKPKQGFGLPFGLWLKSHAGLQDLVYPALESFSARGIVMPEFVRRLRAEHLKGHASYYGYVIWDILMLEEWLRAHNLDLAC